MVVSSLAEKVGLGRRLPHKRRRQVGSPSIRLRGTRSRWPGSSRFGKSRRFCSSYRSVHRWKNGCRVNVERPLFPNYVFASLERHDYCRVLQTPGVLSLVGAGREPPRRCASSEIESLRSGLPLREFEPHPYLVAGYRVRIHSGPLAGMVGVLVRKKNNLRVVLTLDLIMQSVAVEIGIDEIEPVRM